MANQILRLSSATAALVALIAGLAIAHADLSKKVIATFKGQIVVTEHAVDAEGDDKAVIDAYKKARKDKVKGETNGDDVKQWSFNYTAFLAKGAGVDTLKVEFRTDDKDNQYAANQQLMGIDPKGTVLNGEITITEDDGLNPGKTYQIKLVADVRGKPVTLASTTLKFE